MSGKGNKALRRGVGSARHARVTQVTPPRPFWRRAGVRIGIANTVAAAVAGILYGSSGVAYAQDTAPATAAPEDNLQEVVVTANAANGVKKLDASYNIVSVDAEAIKEAEPEEHRGPAEGVAGHLAGILRRSDRRQHRDRRLPGRRRRARSSPT